MVVHLPTPAAHPIAVQSPFRGGADEERQHEEGWVSPVPDITHALR